MDDSDETTLLQLDEPDGNRSVLLEDDGKVAYAYLLEDEKLVGDVWLYNVGENPEHVDWEDRDALPFCNPAEYCSDEELERIDADTDVECEWTETGVTIVVDGDVWARLEQGSRPGWSRGAGAPGPLAKPLEP